MSRIGPFVAALLVAVAAACPPAGPDDADDEPDAGADVADAGADDTDAGAAACTDDDDCEDGARCVDLQDEAQPCTTEPVCMVHGEGSLCFDDDVGPCVYMASCPADLVCSRACLDGACDYFQGTCEQPAQVGDVCETPDGETHPCGAGATCTDDDGAGTVRCE